MIVDEVMTGFRVALGGACELYSLDPDLVTLGKIVGGGLPVGVFGGKQKYMDMLAPLGPVYQAGTLSGNPLAMAAGIATVGYLQEHEGEVYALLEIDGESRGGRSRSRGGEGWRGADDESRWRNVDVVLHPRAGDGITMDAAKSDTAAFGRFHRAMLDGGVWLPPSQFEAAFLGNGARRGRSAGHDRGGARGVSRLTHDVDAGVYSS